MARLWKWCMVIFLLIGMMLGHEDEMMTSLMNTPFLVFDLVLTLILSASLWGGFLNIIEHTGFMNYFSFLFKPLLKMIYGNVIEQDHVYHHLSANIIANLLGLGSLATVSGLKAFQQLNQYNPHPTYPTRAMFSLVIINTAGLSLFPSSLIMLRQQFNSSSPYAFYPYMLLISTTIIIFGLCMQRVIDHE